jgi:hypothetical protein
MGMHPKYTPEELLDKSVEYEEGWKSKGEIIPTLAGLAVHLKVSKECVSRWRKKEKYEKFDQLCARVQSEQELMLISGGLSKTYDASLSKLLLHKHGYSDRIETDNKHNHTVKKAPPVIQFVDDPEPTEVDE